MRKDSYLMDTVQRSDVSFERGYGSHLFSDNDIRYLDFFTDVGTASLGYGGQEHDCAIDALKKQPVHAPNKFWWQPREGVASRLCVLTRMHKVFFCNSGTEAVEAAIKLARRYHYTTGKSKDRIGIWSYKDGFHGRTYGALAAGDGPSHHYEGFGPMLDGFGHFIDIGEIPKDAAAVILSPIFSNNDVLVYPRAWLEELRKYTLDNNIVLIFDEVQTGAGRCGDITYAQKIGIVPDIITLAKGIGMGFPVGAMLANDIVAKAFTPGCHFSTFGGNPASCIFVDAMLDWLVEPGNLGSVNAKGLLLKDELRKFDWAKNVRGEGMLLAFDIDKDTISFAESCLDQKLLIGAFRKGPGTIKITPPLNISFCDLQNGLDKLEIAHQRA